jgi:hypothetical protein
VSPHTAKRKHHMGFRDVGFWGFQGRAALIAERWLGCLDREAMAGCLWAKPLGADIILPAPSANSAINSAPINLPSEARPLVGFSNERAYRAVRRDARPLASAVAQAEAQSGARGCNPGRRRRKIFADLRQLRMFSNCKMTHEKI